MKEVIQTKEHGNKLNPLGNRFTKGRGAGSAARLNVEDVSEILSYGWDRNDLQRMIDAQDWEGISGLAQWIRTEGTRDHGLVVEDDPYFYPLDEDGNYVPGAMGRCLR